MKQWGYFMAVLCLLITACTSDGGEGNEKTTRGEIIGQDTVRITVNSNDQMKFDVNEIVVKENQVVVLILHHTGTMPKASMGHNLVIIDNDISLSNFAKKSFSAKENDYIPESELQNIIAYTSLLGGGESDTITFIAPVKGSYDFLCSFPGHYSIMKGKFIVE